MVYKTKGVCSQSIDVEVENGIVKHVQFTGGCNGNTQGVSRLIEGMDAKEAIKRLEGIRCGSSLAKMKLLPLRPSLRPPKISWWRKAALETTSSAGSTFR